jgi:hypothetical protein
MEDKVMFFCIFLLIVGFIVCQYFSYNGIQSSLQNSVCPACPICAANVCNIASHLQPEQATSQPVQPQKITIDVNQNDVQTQSNPLRDYDYRALSDPLVPPLKRDDYNITVMPIATRGYPTGYKKIGLLINPNADNSDNYKFLILVGRQKYPGSTQYDYFVTENKPDSALKFDLPNTHKELYTDDELYVKELDKTYKVNIDRSLGFEYNPFMY